MTIAQICLIIYLCCFTCCLGGLWSVDRDSIKALRKEGIYIKDYKFFNIWELLVSACPFFNAIFAIAIMLYYNDIIELNKDTFIKELKK